MIEGITSSGFKFHIQEEVLDNMELVDAIAELETNPISFCYRSNQFLLFFFVSCSHTSVAFII